MSIETTITITLASVEVNNEYQVELSTPGAVGPVTALTPDEAVRLADELYEAASEADAALQEDLAQRRIRSIPAGFDIDGPVAS